MRIVVQRVSEAKVEVDEKIIGEIGKGLLLLVGVEDEDEQEDIDWAVKKICALRVFSDTDGRMNLSLRDIEGELLIVSQFTLHASTKKGNRPSFVKAGKPDFAKDMYLKLIKSFSREIHKVESGLFGADMNVSLCNDGPVTIWMDTKNKE